MAVGLGSFGEIRGIMTIDTQHYINGLKLASAATGAFTQEQAMMIRQAQSSAMLGGIALMGLVRPIMSLGHEMNKAFTETSAQIHKIRSVAQSLTDTDMRKIDKSIAQIGKRYGVLPVNAAKAGYSAAQAMYENVSDITAVAAESARLEMASGWEVTTEQAGEMFSRFARQLDLPLDKLSELSDTLLMTREAGILTLDEIAKHAGKASQVFIAAFPENRMGAFKDLMVSAATTSYTLSPDQAFTGLRGAMARIAKEAKKADSPLSSMAKSLGYIDSLDMLSKTGTLTEFMRQLRTAGNFDLRSIVGLGFTNREMSVISAMLNNTQLTKNIREIITGAGAKGAIDRAASIMEKSPEAMRRKMEAAKRAFMDAFGRETIKVTLAFWEVLKKILDGFAALPDAIKQFLILSTVISTMTVALAALAKVLAFLNITGGIGRFLSFGGPAGLFSAGQSGRIKRREHGWHPNARIWEQMVQGTRRRPGIGGRSGMMPYLLWSLSAGMPFGRAQFGADMAHRRSQMKGIGSVIGLELARWFKPMITKTNRINPAILADPRFQYWSKWKNVKGHSQFDQAAAWAAGGAAAKAAGKPAGAAIRAANIINAPTKLAAARGATGAFILTTIAKGGRPIALFFKMVSKIAVTLGLVIAGIIGWWKIIKAIDYSSLEWVFETLADGFRELINWVNKLVAWMGGWYNVLMMVPAMFAALWALIASTMQAGVYGVAAVLGYLKAAIMGTYTALKEFFSPSKGKTQYTELPLTGQYGVREDGSFRSRGWLGEQKLSNGKTEREYIVNVDFGHGAMDIPTLVPGLTKDELADMLNRVIPGGLEPPQSVMDKAIAHASKQLDMGGSVFKKDYKREMVGGGKRFDFGVFKKAYSDSFEESNRYAKTLVTDVKNQWGDFNKTIQGMFKFPWDPDEIEKKQKKEEEKNKTPIEPPIEILDKVLHDFADVLQHGTAEVWNMNAAPYMDTNVQTALSAKQLREQEEQTRILRSVEANTRAGVGSGAGDGDTVVPFPIGG